MVIGHFGFGLGAKKFAPKVSLLVVLPVVAHLAGLFSPLPGSVHAIGWAAQYQWIFVLLRWWVDRNRIA